MSTKANVPPVIVQRLKKEKFAAVRQAKLRLSNIKFDNNNKPMPLNKFDHIIIKKLFELSKKNLLKFNIMGRHRNEKTKLEINYYNYSYLSEYK